MQEPAAILLYRLDYGNGNRITRIIRERLLKAKKQKRPVSASGSTKAEDGKGIALVGLGRHSGVFISPKGKIDAASEIAYAAGMKRVLTFWGDLRGTHPSQVKDLSFGVLTFFKVNNFLKLHPELNIVDLVLEYLRTIKPPAGTGRLHCQLETYGWVEVVSFLASSNAEAVLQQVNGLTALRTDELLERGEFGQPQGQLEQYLKGLKGDYGPNVNNVFSRVKVLPVFLPRAVGKIEHSVCDMVGQIRHVPRALSAEILEETLDLREYCEGDELTDIYSLHQNLRWTPTVFEKVGSAGFVVKCRRMPLRPFLRFLGRLVTGPKIGETDRIRLPGSEDLYLDDQLFAYRNEFCLTPSSDKEANGTSSGIPPVQELSPGLDREILRRAAATILSRRPDKSLDEAFEILHEQCTESLEELEVHPALDLFSNWAKGSVNSLLFPAMLQARDWIDRLIDELPLLREDKDAQKSRLPERVRERVMARIETFANFSRQTRAATYGLFSDTEDTSWEFTGGIQRVLECTSGMTEFLWRLRHADTDTAAILPVIRHAGAFEIRVDTGELRVPRRVLAEEFSPRDLVELPHELGHLEYGRVHGRSLATETCLRALMANTSFSFLVSGIRLRTGMRQRWVNWRTQAIDFLASVRKTLEMALDAFMLLVEKNVQLVSTAYLRPRWLLICRYIQRMFLGLFNAPEERLIEVVQEIEAIKAVLCYDDPKQRDRGNKEIVAPEEPKAVPLSKEEVTSPAYTDSGVPPDNTASPTERSKSRFADLKIAKFIPRSLDDFMNDFHADLYWYHTLYYPLSADDKQRWEFVFYDTVMGRCGHSGLGFAADEFEDTLIDERTLLRTFSVFFANHLPAYWKGKSRCRPGQAVEDLAGRFCEFLLCSYGKSPAVYADVRDWFEERGLADPRTSGRAMLALLYNLFAGGVLSATSFPSFLEELLLGGITVYRSVRPVSDPDLEAAVKSGEFDLKKMFAQKEDKATELLDYRNHIRKDVLDDSHGLVEVCRHIVEHAHSDIALRRLKRRAEAIEEEKIGEFLGARRTQRFRWNPSRDFSKELFSRDTPLSTIRQGMEDRMKAAGNASPETSDSDVLGRFQRSFYCRVVVPCFNTPTKADDPGSPCEKSG